MPEAEVDAEVARLLAFAAGSRVTGGFASLDAAGVIPADDPLELYVTCRMTHVFGLATVLAPEAAGAADLLDHGVEALLGAWQDPSYGGWFAALAPSGDGPADDRKEAYAHAFVVLAGATATAAGHARGRVLLDRALAVLEERFWEDGPGRVAETWTRDFGTLDDYRGLNANMHAVEGLLAAADVVGDAWSLDAAARIGGFVAHELGPESGWRLPEHFDATWTPLPDFNADHPGDPFRPYGATIGHLLEWARLLQHLHVAGVPGLLPAAAALTATATRDGWAVDGADGFVYTVGFDGVPVVRERMHWVVAEGIANAAMRLAIDPTDPVAAADHTGWTDFAWQHHRDLAGGSWWHELAPDLTPSGRVWPGKPDVYHPLQALWLPRLPPSASFAGAISR